MKLLSRSEMYDEFPAKFVPGIFKEEVEKYKNHQPIDTDKVRRLLIHLDNLYSEGKITPLRDAEYDTLHEIYFESTGEVIRGDTDKAKIEHDYPDLRGTLKKVHYVDEKDKQKDPNAIEAHKVLSTWYYNTFAMLNWSKPHKFGVWKKYNGLSIVLSLDKSRNITKAVTRGDTDLSNFGVDKTKLFNDTVLLGYIPKEFDDMEVGVKTECIMKESKFESYNHKYGNDQFVDARAAVTSLVNSKFSTKLHDKYVDLIPLLYEVNGKFHSYDETDKEYGPVAYTCHIDKCDRLTVDELKEMVNTGKKAVDECAYDCDGLVFRWYDDDAMETLGRDETNAVNRFEIAFKFPREFKYTKLIDIEQEIGLLGKVSFTAVFEPVMFNDKTITHASLGSYERMKNLNLAKGDMVKIMYEIIPYLSVDDYCLENKSGKTPIQIITQCPYCGQELDFTPEYSCVNEECPSRIQGKLLNFCIRMNVPGIGPSMIEALFHADIVKNISDFFYLEESKNELMKLDGFGEKTVKHLIKAFHKLSVTEAQLLSSLSIQGIGPKKSNDILEIYNINELMRICSNEDAYLLKAINGISSTTANRLIKGVNDNRELLKILLDNVDVHKVKKPSEVVVFTGFRNPKFASKLMELGISTSETVNDKVNFVIARDPDGNTDKLKKAKVLGIPIISEVEAYERFGFKK